MQPYLDPTRDYYQELGISSAATRPEVESRRLRLLRATHPDKKPDATRKEFEEKFQDLENIFSALLDPQKRQQYDDDRAGRGNLALQAALEQTLNYTDRHTRVAPLTMASVVASRFDTTVTITELIQPLSQSDAPSTRELLSKIPYDIEQNYDDGYDPASFAQLLIQKKIAPTFENVTEDQQTQSDPVDGGVVEATRGETQLMIKEFYSRVETSFTTFFAAVGVETSIPQVVTDRANLFPWSDPDADHYPPHLWIPSSGAKLPAGYSTSAFEIFNRLGLLQSGFMLRRMIPKIFSVETIERVDEQVKAILFGDKSNGATMADLEAKNKSLRKTATDVMQGRNIGDLEDWWSDAKFGQQQFTGTNPVSIMLASVRWLDEFEAAAESQSQSTVGKAALEFIQKAKKANSMSLFVQDFTYFREAIGVKPDATMWNEDRYTVATVSLFHLNEQGILHPISICIDYKGAMDNSVVVFNKSLEPTSEWDHAQKTKFLDEEQDWPWRYAKQCAQSADWVRHEIATHLTHTHLIEEAILVAANRTLPVDHIVFKLLEPHWFRTLSLNAAARQTLVPEIIFGLVGMKDRQPLDLIRYFYENFDFVGGYIPNDLPSRGFPLEELNHEKHRNYVYAKNMNLMWATIRKFVKSMLSIKYDEDADVAKDLDIQSWCKEIQGKGQITTFPTIKTFDELVDACTMCIHIASPQHTAVNYLQNFYHVFIPNKPPALWHEPPSSLADLMKYTEQDVLKSLPVNHQREWMLATQIPWLLSFKTADEHSLLKYSQQLYNLVRNSKGAADKKTKAIAKIFYEDLRNLVAEFNNNSRAMTRDTVPYVVMDPGSTAVSILI